MLIKKTHKISKEKAEILQEILDIPEGYHPDYGRNDVIDTITVELGKGLEVDIKVCNGDTPYVDSVLFGNGYELSIAEVSDTLLGTYCFSVDDEEYEIVLED